VIIQFEEKIQTFNLCFRILKGTITNYVVCLLDTFTSLYSVMYH